MFDELLDEQFRKHRSTRTTTNATEPAGSSSSISTNADEREQADQFDRSWPYRQWTLGVRSLVRLRYLALKKRLLLDRRQELDFEVYPGEIQQDVHQQVKQTRKANSLWPLFLSRPFVYLSILGLVLAALFVSYRSISVAQERAVFKQTLPDFADSVYALKAQNARDAKAGESSVEVLQSLTEQINRNKQVLQKHFAGLPAIQSALAAVLAGVEAKNTSSQEMIERAKRFNDLLFERKIPYYISLFSRSAYCADLPTERFFERLFGGSTASGERCDIHAITVFDLEESRYYADREDSHLALFTRRLDEQDLNDSYLGLVHIGDDRAQVRLSNIRNASADSLTAVSEGVLQSKLMPEGMPDVYGLESFARRLQSNVVNSYIADIERRWWARIPSLWQEIRGNKPDFLSLAGIRLEKRIADVTAFHEVQHLVDQAAQIQEPEWFADAIAPFGARVANPTMREHVLWELSAFFTHFAYAEELQGVLLNEFTSIALNPMLQGQPHYYSIRILLPVLQQQLEGELSSVVRPATTLADVAQAYKSLAKQSSRLSESAKLAYKALFGRSIPSLHEIRVAPRSASRL